MDCACNQQGNELFAIQSFIVWTLFWHLEKAMAKRDAREAGSQGSFKVVC